MMPPLTKSGWERFALAYIETPNVSEAARKAQIGRTTASRLVKNETVMARIRELQAKAEDAKIASVRERKQRLTEIIRAKYPDYVECGADGSWVNIGPESPNPGAIQEVHSRTEYDDKTSSAMVYTSIKLADPVKAISELNKMEGIYPASKAPVDPDGNPVPQVFVQVVSVQGQALTQGIIQGVRTDGHKTETDHD